MTGTLLGCTFVLYICMGKGNRMNKHGWAFLVGAVMIIGGLVMFFAFLNVETPVVGLRQAGLVIAVLGVIEIAATGRSMVRSSRSSRP